MLESRAYLLTPPRLVELSSPSTPSPGPTRPPRITFSQLSPTGQGILDTVGELLCMNSAPARLQIGLRLNPVGAQPDLPNMVCRYILRGGHGTVGYIRMSITDRERFGTGPQKFMAICSSSAHDGPRIDYRYVPTKKVNYGTEEAPNWQTVNMVPAEYPVTHEVDRWCGGAGCGWKYRFASLESS